MRIKQDQRGISNVIVVMLSLVILVTIVANVILWSYQMNQLDWEKMQENISVVNVTRVTETWSYNPSEYALGGSTSNVSGSVSDLTSNDGVYMTFRSYYSGPVPSDFVDQTCDLYSPSAIGAHSNFTAQQTGPDALYDTLTESGGSIEDYVDNNTSDVDNSTDVGSHSNFENQKAKDSSYDTLTEQNTAGASNTTLIDAESFEGAWPPTGWTETGRWNKESNQAYDGTYSADFDVYEEQTQSGDLSTLDLDCSDASAIYVDFWYRDDDLDADDFLLRYYDGSTWDTIADLGSATQEDQWLHYQEKITDSQYFVSTFKMRWSAVSVREYENIWVDLVSVKKEVQSADNYELDLEVQFTNIIDFLPTEKLCIYAGTLDGEDLRVDYWNGSEWENISTDLTLNSWNSYTVSLTSTTFTIRFKGGNETGDTSQDQWQIDASLLRVEGAGSKEDAVDNDTSSVDGSDDIGTLDNFDNMKTKDGMANLTEDDVGGTVWLWQEDTSGYSPTSSYQTFQFWNSWTTNSTTSGTITKIGIYVFADPGNSPQVKLGIYDDSGGSPNNLLGETNATTITGVGWLDLDIVGGGVSISASTTYHVAHITNIAPTTQWRYSKTATPVSDYRDGRVWDNLFDPAGATSKSSSYRYGAYRVGYDEPSNYQLDQEVQWTDVPYLLPNENLSIYGGTMGDEDIRVDVWNGTGWENVFMDLSSGWNNASVTDWLTSSNFTIRFKGGNETGDTSQDTWNVDVALIHIWNTVENYELDLEVQWASVDYDETNEELCIRTGTFGGSEDLQVKVRSGGSWVWVMNLTANQWNNVSVASYLTGSPFTIQFLGGTETSDTTQDSWDIDVTLLHVWSDEYTMEVEFTGSSNMEDWTQLNWTIDSAWTIGSVDVTLQLYNYTLDGYPTSGNGYMSYTSNATANTDETKNQTITVNPTSFRNATGYWKMKVKGVKITDTQFDFKADWIEYKAIKAGGTSFTFENTGSLTCHLVSLWIINSTVHQRHDIDVFINSGETYAYIRDDIDLPDGQCTVKVVTERGNTGVYSII